MHLGNHQWASRARLQNSNQIIVGAALRPNSARPHSARFNHGYITYMNWKCLRNLCVTENQSPFPVGIAIPFLGVLGLLPLPLPLLQIEVFRERSQEIALYI